MTSLHHDGSGAFVRWDEPKALGALCTIRLMVADTLGECTVYFRHQPDGEQFFLPMALDGHEGRHRWFSVQIRVTNPVHGYRFLVMTDQGPWWFNGRGMVRHLPIDAHDFRLVPAYRGPAWLSSTVFYQIFPDRFRDADPASNPRDGEWEIWGKPIRSAPWGQTPSQGHESMLEFFGGDLAGITQSIDYLLELGINALYVNPVFTAWSNHRYDVADYHNVDPHLGGNQALVDLSRTCREHGIRLVLDTVPNHCGSRHPWFVEAQKDPEARTADWFTFEQRPDNYASWLGHKSLPKFNFESESLRRAMYLDKDSVLRSWLRAPYLADGWRLDVANMIGRLGSCQINGTILAEMRAAIKEENPDAFMLGENFFDASAQLMGDQSDAAMNYMGFTNPLLNWLCGFSVGQMGQPKTIESHVPWPTEALLDSWAEFRASIPWELAMQQFNLLDSHDVPRYRERLLHALGPARKDQVDALARLALVVLMTYPGVPCVYYGDEIGMGRNVEHSANRDCMVWEQARWDQSVLDFHKALIKERTRNTSLSVGGFLTIHAGVDTFAYCRYAKDELVVVVANRSPEPIRDLVLDVSMVPGSYESTAGKRLVPLSQEWPVLSVQMGKINLPLLGQGAMAWKLA